MHTNTKSKKINLTEHRFITIELLEAFSSDNNKVIFEKKDKMSTLRLTIYKKDLVEIFSSNILYGEKTYFSLQEQIKMI